MKEDKPSARPTEPRESRPSARGSVNRDPITGAQGAHPVGVGVGAAAGGMAAGAAAGATLGPVGTVVGAAVGAVIGGLAGKSVAELIDPTLEDAYWQQHYLDRPYVRPEASYDDYGPAYRYGVDAYTRRDGRSFDEAETDLAAGWHDARHTSRLDWFDARLAVRDAWTRAHDRIETPPQEDPDLDGRL
jgi:hypothetical protein